VGAWGHRTFEDDTTCDWVWELAETSAPVAFLKESLNVDGLDDYMEYDACASVLAASEAVYSVIFGIRDDPPDDFKNWVSAHSDLDLASVIPDCVTGLKRLLAENSELNELWEENEDLYPRWRENVQQLVDAFSA
jgi:hypothetical protein